MSRPEHWPLNAVAWAQDVSGVWWAYRNVPKAGAFGWQGNYIGGEKVEGDTNANWKDTLVLKNNVSDGSTASYYELPIGATQLQDLISYRNLNAQDGEMFRAIYRKGRASHSDELRDAKKVLYYAQAEVERLEALR